MHPALEIHRRLLERWRGAMDLVGPGPLQPHFDDAIAAVGALGAIGAWADLGSGAGFPGVALAALNPEARVVLVERRQKRAAFLETVLRETGLPATVHDEVATLAPCTFDGVVSRAYKPPAEVLVDAERLLRPGGRVVLLLTNQDFDAAGWTVCHVKPYEIEGRPRRAVTLQRR